MLLQCLKLFLRQRQLCRMVLYCHRTAYLVPEVEQFHLVWILCLILLRWQPSAC